MAQCALKILTFISCRRCHAQLAREYPKTSGNTALLAANFRIYIPKLRAPCPKSTAPTARGVTSSLDVSQGKKGSHSTQTLSTTPPLVEKRPRYPDTAHAKHIARVDALDHTPLVETRPRYRGSGVLP